MMTRAQRIKGLMDEFFADDEAPDAIAPEDTIIHNVSKPFPNGIVPQCPTCGIDVIPGFLSPSQVQCPGCMTDINLAKGNYPYRTHAPNMSRGKYGN